MRRWLRTGLFLGFLAAAVALALKIVQGRRQELSPAEPPSWPPLSSPESSEPVQVGVTAAEPAGGGNGSGRAPTAPFGPPPSSEQPAATPPAEEPQPPVAEPEVESLPDWVEPEEGAYPSTHPVKVKLSSGLFHLPGMAAYNRTTKPDRCYRDEEAAKRDGFTRAKR
jgi:hypothetical protein